MDKEDLQLSVSEDKLIEDINKILSVFNDAITQLQRANYATLNYALLYIQECKTE